jgi:hypothetical protein
MYQEIQELQGWENALEIGKVTLNRLNGNVNEFQTAF